MRRKKNGRYFPGDQIHFIVTHEFVDTANEFSEYCDGNSINASRAMREAITVWLRNRLERERRIALSEASAKDLADRYEREVLKEA